MNKDLRKRLIEFAEGQSSVIGVSEGNDPEESFPVHYFLVEGTYNGRLADDISDLDLKLSNEGYECNLAEFPVQVDGASRYEFLGEVFWKRD